MLYARPKIGDEQLQTIANFLEGINVGANKRSINYILFGINPRSLLENLTLLNGWVCFKSLNEFIARLEDPVATKDDWLNDTCGLWVFPQFEGKENGSTKAVLVVLEMRVTNHKRIIFNSNSLPLLVQLIIGLRTIQVDYNKGEKLGEIERMEKQVITPSTQADFQVNMSRSYFLYLTFEGRGFLINVANVNHCLRRFIGNRHEPIGDHHSLLSLRGYDENLYGWVALGLGDEDANALLDFQDKYILSEYSLGIGKSGNKGRLLNFSGFDKWFKSKDIDINRAKDFTIICPMSCGRTPNCTLDCMEFVENKDFPEFSAWYGFNYL